MRKLIDFHTQGYRTSKQNIARAIRTHYHPGLLKGRRLDSILDGAIYPQAEEDPATIGEKKALYLYLGLTASQQTILDTLPMQLKKPKADLQPLANVLNPIIEQLKKYGYSSTDIVSLSIDKITGTPRINPNSLSGARYAKSSLLLETVRALVEVLESITEKEGKAAVHPDQIEALITASGFTRQKLNNTAHDVITAAVKQPDHEVNMHILLKDIRNARDISVSVPYIARETRPFDPTIELTDKMIINWEHGPRNFPSMKQLHELLARYSHIAEEHGFPPLPNEDIAAVLDLNEKCRVYWQEQPVFEKNEKQKPEAPRAVITPDIVISNNLAQNLAPDAA